MAMADEHAGDAAAGDAAPAKKTSMGVLLGAIVGGIAVGAGVGFFVVGPKVSPAPMTAEETAKAEKEKKKKEEAGKEAVAGKIMSFENIVVNPAGADGGRFVMATVSVEVPGEEDEKKLKAHEVRLRDDITTLIASFTTAQLSGPDARAMLKGKITELLKPDLGEVEPKVYLPQFVIQ
jgi:flagellar FliL protein